MNEALLWDWKNRKKDVGLSVIGLGYVGMPIAVAFSQYKKVIGFDINSKKVELYKHGLDSTGEVGDEAIKKCSVDFTADESKLQEAMFHIIAVPTPVNKDHSPDLEPVKEASRIVGRNIKKGGVVVYESTVYPGVTEEVCAPIIETESGLRCGVDFKIGYSPERINPGDKVHRLENIPKVVAGMDEETAEIIAQMYELVVQAGVYKAESIKIAEAAKVIENSQRDINIAFMNELSIIFHQLGIDTKAVLKAASTKWNFLPFEPGLVGGHCIGVDPYYLTYKAEEMGYHSQVILSGRRINDGMGKYIAECAVKCMISAGIILQDARVAILGLTFKENCPDIRNSKVIDIYNELKTYGINPIVSDYLADAKSVGEMYGIQLSEIGDIQNIDTVIFAVSHEKYKNMTFFEIEKLFGENKKTKRVIIDVKGIFQKELFELSRYNYWRL